MRYSNALAALLLLASCKNSSKSSSKTSVGEPAVTIPSIAQDASPALAFDAGVVTLPPARRIPEPPRGLPVSPSPRHNSTTANKAALGELLFFDTRLSTDGSMSCSTCHAPASGWASPEALSLTATGKRNQRHTPSLWNAGYHDAYYWDGRAVPLEAMILGHWKGQLGADPEVTTMSLLLLPEYAAHFERSFDELPSRHRSAEALASFVRTRRNGDSPWDRYEAGDKAAVARDAIAGAKLFGGKAGCAVCHAPPLFTDKRYYSFQLPDSPSNPDLGRFRVSGKTAHRGAFRTPTLRGVAETAPYFHNGSVATLDEVIEVKTRILKLALTSAERTQIVAYLEALTGTHPEYAAPSLPMTTVSP